MTLKTSPLNLNYFQYFNTWLKSLPKSLQIQTGIKSGYKPSVKYTQSFTIL